jgi:hypothetical protein
MRSVSQKASKYKILYLVALLALLSLYTRALARLHAQRFSKGLYLVALLALLSLYTRALTFERFFLFVRG